MKRDINPSTVGMTMKMFQQRTCGSPCRNTGHFYTNYWFKNNPFKDLTAYRFTPEQMDMT